MPVPDRFETCSPDGCKVCSEVPEVYVVQYGLKYDTNQKINLEGYVDLYWECSSIDRKSTLRCYFSMRLGVISWFSRKESCMALSTTEEKYVATCLAIWEVVCFFLKLLFDLIDLTCIFCMMQRGAAKL